MFLQQIGGVETSDAYSALIFKEAEVTDYRVISTYAVGGVPWVVFTIFKYR